MNVIKRRADYLIRAMKYVAKDLTFENQFLIWFVYIRPYFQYICTLIDTQPQTTQKSFHSLWRNTLKRFVGLPSSIPNTIFSKIMINTVQVTTEARVRLLKKIGIRFGLEEQEEAQINEIDQEEIFIKSFPSNFKVLFAFAGGHCNIPDCHCRGQRLTASCIFQHAGLDFDAWFNELTDPERALSKQETKEKRRKNKLLINRLTFEFNKLRIAQANRPGAILAAEPIIVV